MTTRPISTDAAAWADDSLSPPETAAEVDVAPAPQVSTGFRSGTPLAAGILNWVLRGYGRWIAYLDGRTYAYPTLEALIAGTTAGETAELVEIDTAALPGSSLATFATGANVVDLACDGTYVYVARASVVTRYTRTGGVAGTTYTPTNAGTVCRVVVDGDIVVVAYGTYVECYTASTGASLWAVNHGATVQDVAVDGTQVYLVGAHAANIQLRALQRVGGFTSWTFKHGGVAGTETLYSVATNGRQVFVAGDPSVLASLANVRALNASNGNDFDGEGVASIDTAGLAWNAVSATDMGARRGLACDDLALYAAYDDFLVVAYSALMGTVLVSRTVGDGVHAAVAVDQDWLYVHGEAAGTAYVYALEKRTLSAPWKATGLQNGIATDGAALFVTPTAASVGRIARASRPGRWLRVAAGTLGLPYRWLAIPSR